MTSANRVNYRIIDKEHKTVGSHSQNIMCKRCNDGLEKFTPASDFKIQPWGYDEDEEEWNSKSINLEKWLVENPAEFTFKKK